MKAKIYSMYATAIDSLGKKHVVTIVGELSQKMDSELVSEEIEVPVKNRIEKGVISYPVRQKTRTFRYAYSICHPEDKFNKELGIEIAKKRLARPLGELKSTYTSCLTKDQVEFILLEELTYIKEHIDRFIEREL